MFLSLKRCASLGIISSVDGGVLLVQTYNSDSNRTGCLRRRFPTITKTTGCWGLSALEHHVQITGFYPLSSMPLLYASFIIHNGALVQKRRLDRGIVGNCSRKDVKKF